MSVESKPVIELPTWPKNESLEGIGIPDPIADLADRIIEQGMNDIREFHGLYTDPIEPAITTTSLTQQIGKEYTGMTLIYLGATIRELRYILDTGEHDQCSFDTNVANIARKLPYPNRAPSLTPIVKIEPAHLKEIRKKAHHDPSLLFFIQDDQLMPRGLRSKLKEVGALKKMKILIPNYIKTTAEIYIPENPVNDPEEQEWRLEEIDVYLDDLEAHMKNVHPKPKPAPEIKRKTLEEFRDRFESEDYIG